MHLRTKPTRAAALSLLRRALLLCLSVLLTTSGLGAQSAQQPDPKPTQGPKVHRDPSGDYRLSIDVDLVVLHTTVVNRQGQVVSDLKQEHFQVYEDKVPQKLALFRQEDIPLTVGLVIDNSASMHRDRQELRAAALTFVETSNPLDEVFVVNFNDDYYLDLEQGRDFSSDINELKEALEKTETRGGTALWDALRASINHSKRGTQQKKVLLAITDGVDRYSRTGYDDLLRYAQQSEIGVYIVMLRGNEGGRDWRRARRQLRKLAKVTGGKIYFPPSIEQVRFLCKQIAHDIRNQYVLAYYPTNRARDGSFRTVRVQLKAPKKLGRLSARTRTGYYAPAPEDAGSHGP
ncbi:MAG: VWA domain-containing protein [Terriglobia bacterium]